MNEDYMKSENYAAGYDESVQALKNRPEVVALDKACYEVFHGTKEGKHLKELVLKRFIEPALSNIQSTNFSEQCIYFEGFKEAFRMLFNCALSHEQRIQAEGIE